MKLLAKCKFSLCPNQKGAEAVKRFEMRLGQTEVTFDVAKDGSAQLTTFALGRRTFAQFTPDELNTFRLGILGASPWIDKAEDLPEWEGEALVCAETQHGAKVFVVMFRSGVKANLTPMLMSKRQPWRRVRIINLPDCGEPEPQPDLETVRQAEEDYASGNYDTLDYSQPISQAMKRDMERMLSEPQPEPKEMEVSETGRKQLDNAMKTIVGRLGCLGLLRLAREHFARDSNLSRYKSYLVIAKAMELFEGILDGAIRGIDGLTDDEVSDEFHAEMLAEYDLLPHQLKPIELDEVQQERISALSTSPAWIRSKEELEKHKWKGERMTAMVGRSGNVVVAAETYEESLEWMEDGDYKAVCLGPLWSPPPFEDKPEVPEEEWKTAELIANYFNTAEKPVNAGEVLALMHKHGLEKHMSEHAPTETTNGR